MLKKCRVCKSFRLKKVFSLGKQPLANNLLDEFYQKEDTYPLELFECQHCSLLQLGTVVPKEKMFENYLYVPSISKTYLKHFDDLAKELIKTLKLKAGSVIVDIGSSDGSFLKCFKKRKMKVIGVEPAANLAMVANKAGISTIPEYFSEDMAQAIVRTQGKAKLVTATNVFAHIDDLDQFLRALDILLDDDGVFFAQFPDVRNLLRENQFDTIYHEHLSYYTYEPLHHLFANTPFELWQITSDNIHGGSMRIWVRRRPKILQDFISNVLSIRYDLLKYLKEAKLEKKKIAGFGAAAKGTVLLNYCELDNTIIDYIADGTPFKQHKFIPGVRIPILPEEHLLKHPPDILLILAWNFKEEIMEKLKGRGYTFVIPIPKVEVYEDRSSR